jgi:hypothetical protein
MANEFIQRRKLEDWAYATMEGANGETLVKAVAADSQTGTPNVKSRADKENDKFTTYADGTPAIRMYFTS